MPQQITVGLTELVNAVKSHPNFVARSENASPAYPLIIGISGGSGSGKEYVSKILEKELEAKRLSMDDYYKGAEHTKDGNYDHPDAIDVLLLADHIKVLKAGKPIQKPVYSMSEHKRGGIEQFLPSRLIIIDGIFALLEHIHSNLDLAIHVEAPVKVRLDRRIKRDTQKRGRDYQDIMQQWTRTVIPMHYQFVEPQRNVADIIIDNSENIPL